MTSFTYEFDDSANPLFIEVAPTDDTSPYQPGLRDTNLSDTVKKVVTQVRDETTRAAFGNILHMARYSAHLVRKLKETDPDVPLESVEVEFGLKFVGESQVVLTKGSAEANLTVKVSWKAQP